MTEPDVTSVLKIEPVCLYFKLLMELLTTIQQENELMEYM